MDQNALRLKISGICGIAMPIIGFEFVFLAMITYPQFSWTTNALSDLGVVSGATAIFFNSGLVVAGVLAVLFASGQFIVFRDNVLGRIGAFVFLLGALALIAIGVFPENMKPIHYYVSVTFFVLLPISMLMFGAALLSAAKLKTSVFTFLLAVLAISVWVVQFSARFVPGVAIPETLSALSVSTWSVVLGFNMLQEASSSGG